MGHSTSHLPALRADAAENRDRILAVARELFAEHGLEVQMATVARRAGVGVATLYRRFPTKQSLVTTVFADQFGECAHVLDEALADPDPWHGLYAGITRICEMQAVDRGFSAAFLAAFPDAVDVEGARRRGVDAITELVRRAKESGRLRADFVAEDLVLVLMANNGIVADTPETALAASRRLVAYRLSSFRAEHTEPLPPPVSVDLRDALPGFSASPASPASRR